MKVVIDMQGAQSKFSGKRGVGRYIREMVKELILNRGNELDIYLALNGKLDCDSVLEYFASTISRNHIKIWNFYPETLPAKEINQEKVRPEELFREWFLHQFKADVIWVPNFQEGYHEANIAVTHGLTRGNEHVVATLYDVVPLLFEKEYLSPKVKPWYMKKIRYACDSNVVLTVSEFSKNKIEELFPECQDKVVAIYGGYDTEKFYPDNEYIKAESKESYIFYVGGSGIHKNVEGLIKAYSMLDISLRNRYQICIAGQEPYQNKQKLLAYAKEQGLSGSNINFLGFVSDEELRRLLQRCAAFVFPSFAEGFGLPPLEAMACGAPTLVAAATSLKEVVNNESATFNPYSLEEIRDKLEQVLTDREFANELIWQGLEQTKKFSWKLAALQLKKIFLELGEVSKEAQYSKEELCKDISKLVDDFDYEYKAQVAYSIEDSTIMSDVRHIYVDTSAVVLEDYTSGIQRVVNGILANLKDMYASDSRINVTAVYSSPNQDGFYEAEFNGEKIVEKRELLLSDRVQFVDNDIFIMLDLHPTNVIAKNSFLKQLCRRGVKVYTCLYDMIPINYSEYFEESFVEEYKKYLEIISQFSGVMAISQATMRAYMDWCVKERIIFPAYFKLDYFYLGADIQKANQSFGLPDDYELLLETMKKTPTILMVGTLEPRKGHKQVLKAMETLWKNEREINLVFVGRKGWKMGEFAEYLQNHEQKNRHLFWLCGISDEYLDLIYKHTTGVMLASVEEGYGLPIIEAAQYQKPLLLRNIPVFKEVAGEYAMYFEDDTEEELANRIEKWLALTKAGTAPKAENIPYLTWEESVKLLMEKVMEGKTI